MAAKETILITTDHLRPGGQADVILSAAGHRIRHLSRAGVRDPGELVAALDGVTGAIVGNEPMTEGVLAQASTLRAVVRSGVSYDSIDVEAATRLGISVSNLPGVNSNAVAEYTLGLLLAAARGLVASAAGVAKGQWPRGSGQELRGATLGLVGYGASARAVVPLARAFGMTVLCTSSVPEALRVNDSVRFVDLGALLRKSDYVSVHTALTPRTRRLLGVDAFAAMKPTAVLVNTARGPIVVDGITVYSHMAGQTAQSRRSAAVQAANELVAALGGNPRSAVNAPMITAVRRERGSTAWTRT